MLNFLGINVELKIGICLFEFNILVIVTIFSLLKHFEWSDDWCKETLQPYVPHEANVEFPRERERKDQMFGILLSNVCNHEHCVCNEDVSWQVPLFMKFYLSIMMAPVCVLFSDSVKENVSGLESSSHALFLARIMIYCKLK